MLKNKVLAATMLLVFSFSGIAYATTDQVVLENAQLEQVKVDGVVLDTVTFTDGNCEFTLVDIANPVSDEMSPNEQMAVEKYGAQLQSKAKAKMASHVMPLEYDGGYKDLSINSEANNGRYKLHVSGQWYKNSNNSTLAVKGGRFIQGTNLSGYDGRVIQFTETATFNANSVNGISLSASGFAINGGSSSKTASYQSPAHYNQSQVSYTNYTDITSVAGAFSYSHSGNYRVEMYTGYNGNYINFGNSDSWYM